MSRNETGEVFMETRVVAAIPTVDLHSDSHRAHESSHTSIPPSRALVRLGIAGADFADQESLSLARIGYGAAGFITHLIATAEGIPQTRKRRRVESDCAVSAYAAASRNASPAKHAISESR
jgi:hypothetical protein